MCKGRGRRAVGRAETQRGGVVVVVVVVVDDARWWRSSGFWDETRDLGIMLQSKERKGITHIIGEEPEGEAVQDGCIIFKIWS